MKSIFLIFAVFFAVYGVKYTPFFLLAIASLAMYIALVHTATVNVKQSGETNQ